MEVVRKAAAYVQEHHRSRESIRVEKKGRQNFVTEVDKRTEEILVEGLSEILPESGFITEEGTSQREAETYRWVIDPIDGTTNFIHGAYPFAISVGLTEADEPVAGVVYEFGLDETFCAWKGGGAWLNGRRIHVSDVATVNESLIATGFPYTDFRYLEEFMGSMEYFMRNSNGLRRLGSAATDMAYVACGRYDSFYEYGLHPWDIAAGILLVREAGGEVSDFQGNPNVLFKDHLACANNLTFKEFQETIQRLMLPG